MSDEFGGDIITITDDEGNDFELEHIDALEHNGTTYMAFIPADTDEDNDDEVEFIILKVEEEDGEELLATVDNEQELENIYKLFMERLEDFEDADE